MVPEHPSQNDRDWLTTQLAEFIARAGWERFALAPLIRASASYFPDRYVHGPAGVRTVARRLLRHAGVSDVGVHVVDVREAESERPERLIPRTDIQFVALADNVLELDLVELGAAEDVVPILAHCVARAYRVHRDLDVAPSAGPYRRAEQRTPPEDEGLETQLGTVAAVYLGFGILAANGAERYRAAGKQTGYWATTEWVHDSVGGLDASAVSYLLALQLVVRDVDDASAASVVSELAPNQASDVREWMAVLRPDAAALRSTLGMATPPRDWPAEWKPVLEPLGDDADDDAGIERPETLRARDTAKRNAGRPVFRVRRDRSPLAGTIGALVAIPLAVGLASIDVPDFVLAVPFLVCIAVGVRLGRAMRNDFCSDPRCEGALKVGDAECPRCGGRVAGEIGSQSERLAAEEALEEREQGPLDDEDA